MSTKRQLREWAVDLRNAAKRMEEGPEIFSCSALWAQRKSTLSREEKYAREHFYQSLYLPDSPKPEFEGWACKLIHTEDGVEVSEDSWPRQGTAEGTDVRIIALLLAAAVADAGGL